MELLVVRKAACLYHVRLELMNPKGKPLDREITTRMVERYHFLKYPVTYEDFNQKDGGIVFAMGVSGDVQVQEVRLFQDGLFLWTGESTDRAEAMFSEVIELMVEAGAEYQPEFTSDLSYISEMTVRSEIDLGQHLGSPVEPLLAKAFTGKPPEFATIGYGVVGEKVDLEALRIERLSGVSPSKNEYWSRATLSTANHFQLLQDIERLFA